jgi:hypothetical protein
MDKSNSIRAAFVFIVALSLALWLGVSIVTNQSETLLQFGAAALLLVCVFLGRRIWLLLIFFTALNVPLIRGFGTTELGQVLFIGFTIIIILMRRQPIKFRFGEKEIWMLLVAGSIVQVYLRNPIGLGLFGAADVGAKPYFMAIMAFFSSFILGNIVVRETEIKWALRLSIIGSFLSIALTALRMRSVGDGGGFRRGAYDDGRGTSRINSLGTLSIAIARVVSSFVSPLKGLAHPLWAILILFCVAAAGASGYRTMVATVGIMLLVGIAYRGGFPHVMFATLCSALLLGILALVNLAAPLPPNVQRALSPFPGTWEKRYVEAADISTEWRVEMWKEALFTDYWINDKVLGDGLGFTRRELEMMEDQFAGGGNLDSRSSGMSRQQEAMMVTGGYHSGPVQTVRTTGYVGLGILVLAMIRMAVHAHRQIMRCRGTEWFPLSLYFGIPAIALPPIFIFVFGDFGRDVAAVFFSYGMISLLEKNLPLPAYVKLRRVPYILQTRALQQVSR